MVTWDDFAFTDFQNLYKRIKPLSEYGQRMHHQFQIFQREDVKRAKTYYSVVKKIHSWEKDNKKHSFQIRRHLSNLKIIDSYISDVKNGHPNDISLYEIRNVSQIISKVINHMKDLTSLEGFKIDEEGIFSLERIFDDICASSSGFFIADKFSIKLKELRKKLKAVDRQIFQSKLKLNEAITEILGFEISQTFAVKKQEIKKIEAIEANSLASRVEADKFHIIYKVKEPEKLINLRAKRENILIELDKSYTIAKDQVTDLIKPFLGCLSKSLEAIAFLDTMLSKTKFMGEHNCTIPEIDNNDSLEIDSASHPILDEILKDRGDVFTPRTINLHRGVAAITGMNMGGKTVTLRLIRLLACMVHAGIPVPAKKLKSPLFEFIFYSDGNEDTVETGLSRFGQEISSIVRTFKLKHEYGLICIDEIAQGAVPDIGQAIAISYLEEMSNSNCIVIVTTHYPKVTHLKEISNWRTKGLSEKFFNVFENREINPRILNKYIDYKIELYEGKELYEDQVFKIASALGLNEKLIDKAKELIEK